MALAPSAGRIATPDQGFPAGRSPQLTLRHVRSIFRLLFEVRDLGASPLAWRRHMLTRLLASVEGATGIATEVVVPERSDSPRLLGTVIGGVSDPRLVAVYRALLERGEAGCRLTRDALASRANTTRACTRQEMADLRAWRHRPDVDPWRTLGCEYFLCSNQRLPRFGCVHLILLTRPDRTAPFDELDRRRVALFHSELGRLWRQSAAEAAVAIPACLQRTLELLLEGCSEGEIVARRQLSPHTVHDHVKRLYLRFAVNSRAQLLARLSRSPLVRAPRLCIDLLQGAADDPRFDGVTLAELKRGTAAAAPGALTSPTAGGPGMAPRAGRQVARTGPSGP